MVVLCPVNTGNQSRRNGRLYNESIQLSPFSATIVADFGEYSRRISLKSATIVEWHGRGFRVVKGVTHEHKKRTNKKSHAPWCALLIGTKKSIWPQMVLNGWSVTLAEIQKKFYGAHQENLNKNRPILSAAQCTPMITVFRNIRYMRIYSMGSSVRERQTTKTAILIVLNGYLFVNFRQDILL